MKFYSKRGNLININSSKIINEIFYNIEGRDLDEIIEDFIFIMKEDKNLVQFTDTKLLNLEIDIVPNSKRKRMRYNFLDFNDLYTYLKEENNYSKVIPYAGEDIK
jgi:hypothetical protein